MNQAKQTVSIDRQSSPETVPRIPASFYDDVFAWIQEGSKDAFQRVSALVESARAPEVYEEAVRSCLNPDQDIAADEKVQQLLELFSLPEIKPEDSTGSESRVLKLCEEIGAFTRIDLEKGLGSSKVHGRGLPPLLAELIETARAAPQSAGRSTPVQDALQKITRELAGYLLTSRITDTSKQEIGDQVKALQDLLNNNEINKKFDEIVRPNGVDDADIPDSGAERINAPIDLEVSKPDQPLNLSADPDVEQLAREDAANLQAGSPAPMPPQSQLPAASAELATGADPIKSALNGLIKSAKGAVGADQLHHFNETVRQLRQGRE